LVRMAHLTAGDLVVSVVRTAHPTVGLVKEFITVIGVGCAVRTIDCLSVRGATEISAESRNNPMLNNFLCRPIKYYRDTWAMGYFLKGSA